jgi:hypothetical protein
VTQREWLINRRRDADRLVSAGHGLREVAQLGQGPRKMGPGEHRGQPRLAEPLPQRVTLQGVDVRSQVLYGGTNGQLQIEQSDGTSWKVVSEWTDPLRDVVGPRIEEAAIQEGKRLGYQLRDCSKEN